MRKITPIKLFFSTCLLLLATTLTHAQVGIGTSNVNTSARLQVDATNKGFLPPRVTLTGTADASTILTPATGLLVYNTATAGTSPSNVTPGFYYYDGAKWQRIINQQPDATVSFNTADPNTGSPTFTPSNAASTDFIYVSSVNNSQWTWNGSAYVTYTSPASTPWMLSGGSTDAGSNKSGAIYRTGSVGIGSNTIPNASAQLDVNSTTKGFLPPRMTTAQRSAISGLAAGLIVYNTSIGQLEYFNGTSWTALVAGNAPMYAQFSSNAGQYFNAIGTKMLFQVTDINVSSGSITNTSNGTISLPSGRIYRIDLNLGWALVGWSRFAIFNTTSGAQLSRTAHIEGGSGNWVGTGLTTCFIDTNSGAINIEVRFVGPLNSNSLFGDVNNGTNFPTLTIQTVD